MRALIDLSAKFAGEALNLLMDLLNDPSMAVRLETLETLHHMAICGHFKVQEMHMHAVGSYHFSFPPFQMMYNMEKFDSLIKLVLSLMMRWIYLFM